MEALVQAGDHKLYPKLTGHHKQVTEGELPNTISVRMEPSRCVDVRGDLIWGEVAINSYIERK